jgi:hypothetical protein
MEYLATRLLPRNRRTSFAPESARRPLALPQSVQPELPGSFGESLLLCRLGRRTRKHPANRQNGRCCFFDHNGVSSRAHFSPDFFGITFKVPVASSLPSFPGTVITEARNGCLKWRWLPFARISTHPWFSRRRTTSRTFIGVGVHRMAPKRPGNYGASRCGGPELKRVRPVRCGWD